MYSVANTPRRYDNRQNFQRSMEKLSDWSRKPLTPRAECAAAALAGSAMFWLFFIVAGLA